MMFIGVMTNSLFAQVRSARPDVNAAYVRAMTFAINLGLAGFVLGLLADEAVLKRIFTPIMGTGILFGIVIFTIALRKPDSISEPQTV
jgi:hypothetical protein